LLLMGDFFAVLAGRGRKHYSTLELQVLTVSACGCTPESAMSLVQVENTSICTLR
jgi:hypothetical protein